MSMPNDYVGGIFVSCSQFLLMCPNSPAALVPGQVHNLRSTQNTIQPSVTLNWDRPVDTNIDDSMITYDIRFRPYGSVQEGDYFIETVKAPTTSVILTRESGLKLHTKYDFEVRARNSDKEGKWSQVSDYIGMCVLFYLAYHTYPKCQQACTTNVYQHVTGKLLL